jgi:hypothetical protein
MEPITTGTLALAGLSWIGGTVAGAAGGVADNVSDRALCRLTRGVWWRAPLGPPPLDRGELGWG